MQKELELKAQIFDLLYLIEQYTLKKNELVRELAEYQQQTLLPMSKGVPPPEQKEIFLLIRYQNKPTILRRIVDVKVQSKGQIIMPVDEVEKDRQEIINENKKNGKDTKLSELI